MRESSRPTLSEHYGARVLHPPAVKLAQVAVRASVEAASREFAAGRALSVAEEAAKAKPVSMLAAYSLVLETAGARRALQEAAELRSFWRAAAEREASSKSWAGRLGFGREITEQDPVSGEVMTPAEGLRSERALAQRHAKKTPVLWCEMDNLRRRKVCLIASVFRDVCPNYDISYVGRRYRPEGLAIGVRRAQRLGKYGLSIGSS